MENSKQAIVILIGNLEIESIIYRDAEGNSYAKINNQFFSIDTLKYMGWKIKAPG